MRTPLRLPTFSALALALVLVAAACDSATDPAPQVMIRVQDATIQAVGDAQQLIAVVDYSRERAVWESLNPEIVTVTPEGVATAVASGTARVRARVGTKSAEGNVIVLPPVEVQILSLRQWTHPVGAQITTMELRNVGGRGSFRVEGWQMRTTPVGEHRLLETTLNNVAAPVNTAFTEGLAASVHPDWVVIYSREPNSMEFRMTGCMRVDGGTPCPAL